MTFEISRNFRFEAAHKLPNVPSDHKCARLHGHSFSVTIVVRGDLDPRLQWVADFADLKAAWQPLHEILDHRYLNEIVGLENPTSEVLARFIAERIDLPTGRVHLVCVAETCHAAATYYPD
ncbi:MAG: 6-carboxytetrahydropterin synthase QueD [Polyangiales bacterium]